MCVTRARPVPRTSTLSPSTAPPPDPTVRASPSATARPAVRVAPCTRRRPAPPQPPPCAASEHVAALRACPLLRCRGSQGEGRGRGGRGSWTLPLRWPATLRSRARGSRPLRRKLPNFLTDELPPCVRNGPWVEGNLREPKMKGYLGLPVDRPGAGTLPKRR